MEPEWGPCTGMSLYLSFVLYVGSIYLLLSIINVSERKRRLTTVPIHGLNDALVVHSLRFSSSVPVASAFGAIIGYLWYLP